MWRSRRLEPAPSPRDIDFSYARKRLGLLAAVFATAFAFGLAAEALFGSRSAGAIGFFLVFVVFILISNWSAGRSLSPSSLRQLVALTILTLALVLLALAFVPSPFGLIIAFIVATPVANQWRAAAGRGRSLKQRESNATTDQ
jgi:hypothetical protein